MTGNILIVQPNAGLLTTLDILLKKHFSKVLSVPGLDEMTIAFEQEEIDVLLLDMSLCSPESRLIAGLLSARSDVEIVLLSTFAQAGAAVEGVNSGAFDYVSKPWNNDRLIISIKNAIMAKRYKKAAGRIDMLKEGLQEKVSYFWGISPSMKRVYNEVHKLSHTGVPVLINGEYGCGKELLAREIHSISRLSGKSFFISMEPDQASDANFSLKLELAQQGTFFINNIDRLPLSGQQILLDVIKSGKYKKGGENVLAENSLRFIFGCAVDLEKRVLQGEFLEELYNRITVLQINIPSLKERREDIQPLASVFLEKYCSKYAKKIKGFNRAAVDFLKNYNWPGNVSELAVTIEKAVVLCDKMEISPLHFQTLEEEHTPVKAAASSESGAVFAPTVENETLEQMEMRVIRAVLARNRGNMSLTAQQLGITRQTLYNKGKKYRLID